MMGVMPTDAPIEAAARNHAAFIWSVADLLRGDYRLFANEGVVRFLSVADGIAGWGGRGLP